MTRGSATATVETATKSTAEIAASKIESSTHGLFNIQIPKRMSASLKNICTAVFHLLKC